MNEAFISRYRERMRRVLAYIDAHLDDDLGIDVLSGVAACSPYHFHRQFSGFFGMTAHRYVQDVRMKRAAHRLAFRTEGSILQIALDSGYASPEGFARAFRQWVGQTPAAFRERPDWIAVNAVSRMGRRGRRETTRSNEPLVNGMTGTVSHARRRVMNRLFSKDQIRIVDFPSTEVAVLEHRGDPVLLGDSIRRFIAWRKQTGLSPRDGATFNVLHNDPEATAPDAYRLDICAATQRAIAPNRQGVRPGTLPGGRCAMLRLTGSSDDLRPAIAFLYADWLPQSGEELRDFPVFVQRVSFFPDVPEHLAVTEIFLPLT